eukprot:g73091.t1
MPLKPWAQEEWESKSKNVSQEYTYYVQAHPEVPVEGRYPMSIPPHTHPSSAAVHLSYYEADPRSHVHAGGYYMNQVVHPTSYVENSSYWSTAYDPQHVSVYGRMHGVQYMPPLTRPSVPHHALRVPPHHALRYEPSGPFPHHVAHVDAVHRPSPIVLLPSPSPIAMLQPTGPASYPIPYKYSHMHSVGLPASYPIQHRQLGPELTTFAPVYESIVESAAASSNFDEPPLKKTKIIKVGMEDGKSTTITSVQTGELNEIKFQCQLCPRSYSSAANLKRHMRTHVGIKPHRCTKCSKSFFQISDLRRHMISLIHRAREERSDVPCACCAQREKEGAPPDSSCKHRKQVVKATRSSSDSQVPELVPRPTLEQQPEPTQPPPPTPSVPVSASNAEQSGKVSPVPSADLKAEQLKAEPADPPVPALVPQPSPSREFSKPPVPALVAPQPKPRLVAKEATSVVKPLAAWTITSGKRPVDCKFGSSHSSAVFAYVAQAQTGFVSPPKSTPARPDFAAVSAKEAQEASQSRPQPDSQSTSPIPALVPRSGHESETNQASHSSPAQSSFSVPAKASAQAESPAPAVKLETQPAKAAEADLAMKLETQPDSAPALKAVSKGELLAPVFKAESKGQPGPASPPSAPRTSRHDVATVPALAPQASSSKSSSVVPAKVAAPRESASPAPVLEKTQSTSSSDSPLPAKPVSHEPAVVAKPSREVEFDSTVPPPLVARSSPKNDSATKDTA